MADFKFTGTDFIGWVSAGVLLATLLRQVYSQWRNGSASGVSRWLFVGQLTASVGFIAYSWLVGNGVFVVTNVLILLTALAGEWVTIRNRRARRRRNSPTDRSAVVPLRPRGVLLKGNRPTR